MKFVDYKNKEINKQNRNYFWIVSISYCALLILIYACLGTSHIIQDGLNTRWEHFDGIRSWLIGLERIYTHSSWLHVLHNCLGFMFGAFYIERKMGSLNFAMLLGAFTILFANTVDGGCGNSMIWFALYAYMLVDYLFSFRKGKRNITNIIVGAVCLALEYIRSGFFDMSGGGIGWGFAPVQLYGHFEGFVMGLGVALIVQVAVIKTEKKLL